MFAIHTLDGDRLIGEIGFEDDDLPPGEYQVFTGWYSYPDMQRFGVQANTPHAQDGLAFLGNQLQLRANLLA